MVTGTFNAGAADYRQCSVRFSTAADIPAICAYYAGNRHQHVDALDPALIADVAAKGRYLLVLDADGSIAASSGGYDYHNDQNDQQATWIEIGSTRARLEGFNLYPFMISSQVIHEFLTQTPRDHFFANIFKNNTAVSAMLEKKVGWTPFEPDDTLLELTGERASHERGELVWLKTESHSLPHQARVALDYIRLAESSGITNRKTGETMKLDTSKFPLATTLRPILESLAYGPLGKMLENAPHTPFSRVRETLRQPPVQPAPLPPSGPA